MLHVAIPHISHSQQGFQTVPHAPQPGHKPYNIRSQWSTFSSYNTICSIHAVPKCAAFLVVQPPHKREESEKINNIKMKHFTFFLRLPQMVQITLHPLTCTHTGAASALHYARILSRCTVEISWDYGFWIFKLLFRNYLRFISSLHTKDVNLHHTILRSQEVCFFTVKHPSKGFSLLSGQKCYYF